MPKKKPPRNQKVFPGEVIRERRQSLGYDVQKLSELSGCTVASIYKYEEGTRIPKSKSLWALCNVLALQIEQLIDL